STSGASPTPASQPGGDNSSTPINSPPATANQRLPFRSATSSVATTQTANPTTPPRDRATTITAIIPKVAHSAADHHIPRARRPLTQTTSSSGSTKSKTPAS